ncbi:MAG: DUF2304 domain-containing protein [Thermoleophilaceae bacterium]
MELRIQLVAIIAAAGLFVVVLELVRRRRLLERYALLWLFSALALLGLAVWSGLLEQIARLIGIIYPPNALFLIAFGFVLLLLLHFSLAVSRLTDQTKVLAQRLALLEQRQGRPDGEPAPDGEARASVAGRSGGGE